MLKSYAEAVIKMMNQEKKRKEKQKNDIRRGYAEIFYDTVLFERKKLCGGAFSMMLPVSFHSMKKGMLLLKYGTKHHPDFVYTNDKGDVNMTFSFLHCEEIGKDILQVQQEMEQDIKELHGNIVLEKNVFNTKQNLSVIQFSFPLQRRKDSLLNVIFLFLIKNDWVVGTFHCPDVQKRDWINIIMQMLLSIQLEGQEKSYE